MSSGKFSILILTIGIPGSGKTRWVKKYMQKHKLTYVISTDEIRKELTGHEQCIDPLMNDMIHDEARKRVKKILDDPNSTNGAMGPEIIVDSTNCELNEWIKYKELGASVMRAIVFERTPEQAFENEKNRERKVPLEILKMKYDQYNTFKIYLTKIFNMIDYIHHEE
jgi:predicted kinase